MPNTSQNASGPMMRISPPFEDAMPSEQFHRVLLNWMPGEPVEYVSIGIHGPVDARFGEINNKITDPMMWVFSQIEE